MNYSPKLKKAAQEIKNVLKKHDIAGLVVLHTPGNGEYVLHLTPSYSCISIDKVSGFCRIKATEKELGKEKRNQVLKDTSNMLSTMKDITHKEYSDLKTLSDFLDAHVNATHTGGESGSHQSQNN